MSLLDRPLPAKDLLWETWTFKDTTLLAIGGLEERLLGASSDGDLKSEEIFSGLFTRVVDQFIVVNRQHLDAVVRPPWMTDGEWQFYQNPGRRKKTWREGVATFAHCFIDFPPTAECTRVQPYIEEAVGIVRRHCQKHFPSATLTVLSMLQEICRHYLRCDAAGQTRQLPVLRLLVDRLVPYIPLGTLVSSPSTVVLYELSK